MTSRLSDRLFPIAYLLSGAAGLLYEVTWSRLLALQMGHTAAAVGTVLAAFMGGLAAGATIAGRWSGTLDRARAARAYSMVEVAVAALALVLPWLLTQLDPMLAAAYRDGNGGTLFAVARAASSFVLLSVPAALMGATFPLAVRAFAGPETLGSRDANMLYALNTTGAALGSIVTGFVLIPSLGLRGTTLVGMALNLLAGAIAWHLSARLGGMPRAVPADATATRGAAPAPRRRRAETPAKRPPTPPTPPPAWHIVSALAVSGFVGLTWEVVWTRLLVLIIGPTTYAFSTMLTAFIGGFAIGAGIGTSLARRLTRPLAGAGAALLLAACAALLAAAWLDALPLHVASLVTGADVSFARVAGRQALMTCALLLPMTTALGAAFPLAIAAARSDHADLSRQVSRLYAVNTAAAIAGSLGASFLLIPRLGLHATMGVAAVGAAGAGGALMVSGARRLSMRLAAGGLAVAVVAAAVLGPGWDRQLLSSGAYKYAGEIRSADIETGLRAGSLVYYKEGGAGTVSVKDIGGVRSLAIDGKVDASNGGDMLTQSLLAHVPLLLHPQPSRAAIIGLGSGVTLGAALRHPLQQVDVLEISPEVVEASRLFTRENHDGLSDPRTRLIVGDGRSHLRLGRTDYDVIVSEPSNPWMAGVATLFTREFFASARARLAPGGILCQWAHTYDLSADDLRSIVGTFVSVFPNASLWLVGEGDILLVGASSNLSLADIAARWRRPGVAEDLAAVGVADPFALLSLYVADGPALAAFAAGARTQTDDRTALEYSAPRALYDPTVSRNADALIRLRETSAPPAAVLEALHSARAIDWRNRGLMLLHADAPDSAYRDLVKAIGMDPEDAPAFDALIEAGTAADRGTETLTLLAQMADRAPHLIEPRLALSRLAAATGDTAKALARAGDALAIDAGHRRAQLQLASILSDVGDAGQLAPVVSEMQSARPDDPGTLYYVAVLRFLQGDFAGAIAAGEACATVDPGNSRVRNLLGAAYASVGNTNAARQSFNASIRLNPRDPATYVNLAAFERQSSNLAAASEYYAEALAIDPSAAGAVEGLAETLEVQGLTSRAAALRGRARR